MPNRTPDQLTNRLQSLLHSTESALAADDNETYEPAPSAGGIPVMVITDLPLAATPDKYKAPPMTPEEEIAFARVRENMDLRYAESLAAPVSEATKQAEPAPVRTTVRDLPLLPPREPDPNFDVFSFPASRPFSPSYKAPTPPQTVLTHPEFLEFRNTVVVGRNSVPAGLYRVSPDTVVVVCRADVPNKVAAHSRHMTISGTDDQRIVCVVDVCNSIDLSSDLTDETPHFYGLIWDEVKQSPQLCRVLLSSVQVFRPIASDTLLGELRSGIRSFAQSLASFAPNAVEPVLANLTLCPATLVEPEMLATIASSISVTPLDPLSVLLPLLRNASRVNQDDLLYIQSILSEVALLEAQRQRHLNTIAGIASKYTG